MKMNLKQSENFNNMFLNLNGLDRVKNELELLRRIESIFDRLNSIHHKINLSLYDKEIINKMQNKYNFDLNFFDEEITKISESIKNEIKLIKGDE